MLDSLGYTAAALLPVAAWLVRICTTNEPPAARSCVAAAVGPARAHLACLLVALITAAALGTAATLVVTLISDPASADHRTRVSLLAAAAAGLLATLACALLGTAVGALTNWPLLRSPGRAVPAMLLAALLAVVVPGAGGGQRPGHRLAVRHGPGPAAATGRCGPGHGGRDRRDLRLHLPPFTLNRRCAAPPATRTRGTA